ncbi:hypothetical protein ENSA5_33420 [Enhygromyxa salina]|uniref:Uncharacterized protein n=1 Tax=Enhygromyxa salina TaxID=215803 RepID=A0A2S9XXB6_9BACT|nr:hypothetical protein ENSA5_33420 [Enhygromyxa salina]
MWSINGGPRTRTWMFCRRTRITWTPRTWGDVPPEPVVLRTSNLLVACVYHYASPPPRTLAARGAMPRAASLGLFADGFVAKTCSTPGTAAFWLRALGKNSGARRPDALHPGLLAARGAMPRAASLGLFADGFVAKTCSTPGTAAFWLRALGKNSGARRHDALHPGLLAEFPDHATKKYTPAHAASASIHVSAPRSCSWVSAPSRISPCDMITRAHGCSSTRAQLRLAAARSLITRRHILL